MGLPFQAGNTAIVLLGDGLDELGKELEGYCQHLKSAYDAAYGPAEACAFRIVRFNGNAYGELWSILPARQEWTIFAVSHDIQAVAELIAALGAGVQGEEGGAAAPLSGGKVVAVGIVLTDAQPDTGPPPSSSFFCETASAQMLCKVLILHNHSARCICADIADLLTISNSKPIRVEEHPPFDGEGSGYAVLLVRGGLGVWGVIKYECAWTELKAHDGWETETFDKLLEFADTQAGPDAGVIIFDLWEPTAG